MATLDDRMPTILLHGDPRGWGTNNRPTKQPLVKASAEAWARIATPIELRAAFAVRFRWPDPQEPDHWGSSRVIDTDGTATVAKAVLDGAVRAGIKIRGRLVPPDREGDALGTVAGQRRVRLGRLVRDTRVAAGRERPVSRA